MMVIDWSNFRDFCVLRIVPFDAYLEWFVIPDEDELLGCMFCM